jgi:hypothetical protein
VPNYGPDSGGNKVLIKGNNFRPFDLKNDIDNTNDTFVSFEGIGKVKAHVINSTKMWVEAPPNFILDVTYLEITLNNQQYTDDNIPYYYFRPPKLYDVDPREGPTKGGTEVTIYGDDFKERKKIRCNFGNKWTRGKWMAKNKVKCTSPPVDQPGFVPLTISYDGEHDTSQAVQFLYYETPIVASIEPSCGPVTGYTQISVKGDNFINMGFGRAKCIFNHTIYTNATIMDKHNIKCDSPMLDTETSQGADSKAPYYYVSVTLNNGREFSSEIAKFTYYWDPVLKSILPNKGPMRGGTKSVLESKGGFKQEGACNTTVRYGPFQYKPEDKLINDTTI